MASRTVVELFDDLDGGRADETVSFALDGVDYEIDLSTANAAQLRSVLAEYVSHAHRAPTKAKRAERPERPERPGRPAKSVTLGPAPDAAKPSAGHSASMTAEIRRLASESARKASEAAERAEQQAFDVPELDLPQPPRPAQEQEPQREQVRALVIPFQEAGL